MLFRKNGFNASMNKIWENSKPLTLGTNTDIKEDVSGKIVWNIDILNGYDDNWEQWLDMQKGILWENYKVILETNDLNLLLKMDKDIFSEEKKDKAVSYLRKEIEEWNATIKNFKHD